MSLYSNFDNVTDEFLCKKTVYCWGTISLIEETKNYFEEGIKYRAEIKDNGVMKVYWNASFTKEFITDVTLESAKDTVHLAHEFKDFFYTEEEMREKTINNLLDEA